MEGIQAGLFDENNNDGDTLTLAEYAEQAYLDYAVSVVRGRALPEVADGQKPVQRRILYAMQAMGLGPDARPVKSARVVGDVLGKYHPHGDQAAYDAMVRMAQNFVLRYPLIDGQGNFGSRDGDNAAAMRYTEARLTAFSRVLLDELHEGTVDFAPNYDGSQEEPLLLPARLPVVLLNGASGIAVGMATEIPPHNLNEVVGACIALLKKPSLSDAELQQLIPGPDFPGGGQIITPQDDIAQVYQSGRGSIKVRARWHIEELARGQWQLVVHELPPFTSAQKVLEEIDNLTNPRPRGNRKTLSSEQQQTRSLVLSLLDTVRDESGKDEAVRLVFEPKSSRIDHDEFINLLLTQTSLEGNVTINLVCIGTDSRPAQKGLRAILQDWLDYRLKTITRRSQYRLEKVSDRIHVLEGRMVVYLNVDEVIQTIRDSDEPRDALMQRFQLTQRQADDILEMRLRQLARLEGIRIEKELAKLRDQQTELEALLASPTALKRLLTTELRTDAKTYGDERRTLIQTAEQAVLETPVVDEALSVVVSRQGWLRTRQGHGHDASLFTFKSGDGLYDVLECRSVDNLVALADDGRVYTIAVADLPSSRGDGQPVTTLADIVAGTRVEHVIGGNPDSRYVLASASANGFICTLGDMMSRQRAGKQFLRLSDDEPTATLLKPLYLHAEDTHLALLSAQGRLLIIELSELRVLPDGGRGTRLMTLDDDDSLVQWVGLSASGINVTGVYRRRETSEHLSLDALADYVGRRARKGRVFKTKFKQPRLEHI